MNISIVGLGKLGLPFAFFLASFKNRVFAYDINQKIINHVNNKKTIFIEPELKKHIRKYKKNVLFKKSIEEVINETDITFLVLPTPSLQNGSFSNKYIINVLIKIAQLIKLKKKTHFINITSTVNPSSCEKIFIPLMESYGLVNKKDFFIIYNPHFIAQGTTFNNLKKPDILLIGTDDNKSKKKILNLYKNIYKKKIYKVLNLTESEITKLSVNSYITNKISFANYIAEISENLLNVNAVKILDAIGNDKRIGQSYFKLGTKFSGPCFPRDNKSLSFFSKKIGVNNYLPESVDKVNQKQTFRIIKKINFFSKTFKNKINIGLLGITYKSDTNVIVDSQSYDLIKKINHKFSKIKRINFFDSYVKKQNFKIGNNKIYYTSSINKLVKSSDIILIMYKDKQFLKITNIIPKRKKVVIDCWNLIKNLKKPYIYSQLGNIN